jgi:hypothetical protein
MTSHVHETALEDVAGVSGMQRIDLGVFGTLQIVEIVALNRLVQKREPESENEGEDNDSFNCETSLWGRPMASPTL